MPTARSPSEAHRADVHKEHPLTLPDKTNTLKTSARLLVLAAACGLSCGAVWSQPTQSKCDPRQDPAACARESGAARQEAARGGLTQPGASADVNATDRCKALPAAERTDCEA